MTSSTGCMQDPEPVEHPSFYEHPSLHGNFHIGPWIEKVQVQALYEHAAHIEELLSQLARFYNFLNVYYELRHRGVTKASAEMILRKPLTHLLNEASSLHQMRNLVLHHRERISERFQQLGPMSHKWSAYEHLHNMRDIRAYVQGYTACQRLHNDKDSSPLMEAVKAMLLYDSYRQYMDTVTGILSRITDFLGAREKLLRVLPV
jgi:hypothetical protein